METTREATRRTNRDSKENETRFADHLRTNAAPYCRRYASVAEYIRDTRHRFSAGRPGKPGECVYFIGADEGPVKIGVTCNVEQRLQNLQTASPVRLRVLATIAGGSGLERGYHEAWSHYRLHGEWFERSKQIEQELRHLRSRAIPPRSPSSAV